MTRASLAATVMGLVAAVSPAANAAVTSDIGVTRQASSTIRAAVTLVPVPVAGLRDGDATVASQPTVGMMTSFDFVSRRNLFIGVAPRYVGGLKAINGNEKASREFDVLIRLGYDQPIGGRVHAYGYLAPGYSFVSGLDAVTAQGLVLGVHAGGLVDLTSDFFCLAEAGYQAGYQLGVDGGAQFPFSISLLEFGLGLGVRI